MRLVTGSGRTREVLELPHFRTRAQNPEQHQRLIENLQERICPREMSRVQLRRKGFRIYED